jgi:hypothetical protein
MFYVGGIAGAFLAALLVVANGIRYDDRRERGE